MDCRLHIARIRAGDDNPVFQTYTVPQAGKLGYADLYTDNKGPYHSNLGTFAATARSGSLLGHSDLVDRALRIDWSSPWLEFVLCLYFECCHHHYTASQNH